MFDETVDGGVGVSNPAAVNAIAGPVQIRARKIPHGDHDIYPTPGRERADVTVITLGIGPELCHQSQHGDASPLGRQLAEQTQRGLHRGGVRVVGIVDDLDAAWQLD